MPISETARAVACVSFATSALFMFLLVALHLLRPDLDPSWRFISEYELGDYGWVMQVAFFTLSLSCVAFCVAIVSQVRMIAGYIGLALVILAAFGMALAGAFVPDPLNNLHEVGAQLDHLPFGAPLINWSLSRNPAWFPAKRMLRWTAFLPLLGLVLFVGSLIVMLPANGGKPGPTVLAGWPNRVMIVLHCAWLMPVARFAMKLAKGARQGRVGTS
ncbi:MAG: DUF998 domain-containing protein [Planctomycetales bacterium]